MPVEVEAVRRRVVLVLIVTALRDLDHNEDFAQLASHALAYAAAEGYRRPHSTRVRVATSQIVPAPRKDDRVDIHVFFLPSARGFRRPLGMGPAKDLNQRPLGYDRESCQRMMTPGAAWALAPPRPSL
jgi:hypothetical protein